MFEIRAIARGLRRDVTASERIFWELVRNRRLAGLKFSRQVPFSFTFNGQWRFFIVDFYCAARKFVIELDGGIHDQQLETDEARTQVLECLGVRVLRIRNEELAHVESVLRKVLDAAGELTPRPPL